MSEGVAFVVDTIARDSVLRLCKVLNGHRTFNTTDDTEAHREMEAIRIELGDDDLADHVELRAAAEEQRQSEMEKERARQKSKEKVIESLRAELDFLKQQMKDADAEAKKSAKSDAEIAELRAMVQQLLESKKPAGG